MQLRPSSSANFRRPLYLWNLMIRNSTNEGFFTETLKIYSSMANYGVHGNNFTYPLVLKACANLDSILDGTKLHSHVIRSGFQGDVFVQTALIDMYSKCSHSGYSRKVFDEMSVRSTVSWNSMISAYCRGFRIGEAMILLQEMWLLGFEPTSSTFVSILSGCSNPDSSASLCQGLSIHCCVIKLGVGIFEIPLANSMMSMYIHFGQIDKAHVIFNTMDEKSIISWTTIIGAYVNIGDATEAFSIFNQMRCESMSLDSVIFINLISGSIKAGYLLLAMAAHSLILKSGCDDEDPIENLLVSMYAKCGDLTSARRIFDMASEKSIFLWTSMIGGYTHFGHPAEALDLFQKLIGTATKPNETTIATILSACADLGSVSQGKEIEEYILLNGLESDKRVQTSLIHMFCKCGSINKAREIFERVVDKDLAVWSSMINGYAIHGRAKEALSLFHKMQNAEGIMPDAVIYTCILLACCHSGLIEDGLKYFHSMQKDFGIEPTVEHYTCLVDLLGRFGQLDLALNSIQEMPVQAQAQAWVPFLSACRTHRNVELGELASVRLLELSPESSGNYVLMANLYTSLGKWREADMTRKLIDDQGLVKECGWSQIEVYGRIHAFVAGDKSHMQSVDIYKNLKELNSTLLEAGCTAAPEMLNHDI
ncbi:Pentatricopeptide repeat [Quillaja saponaria]|uniref:Pentatricopeptide repeat n=1 Tax=Quillaja saponaria TaxID=32244 RepID=A0AAD7M509_QUISA|nr:Pentatricopeptide repeat [Quillaja saponaria]KAJ7970116.1 Pentatricopeptide repeat [Quillaja saponaria]